MKDIFGNEEIRMLSFWQPFAGLMLYGKTETRKWATKYRGLILICSTFTPFERQPSEMQQLYDFSSENKGDISLAKTMEKQNGHDVFDLNGYAIAIGRLVQCRKVKLSDKTYFMHPPELYAHVYEDVKRIKPFPLKGFQGLPRRINDDIKSKIEIID